jgi:hypothetical protein
MIKLLNFFYRGSNSYEGKKKGDMTQKKTPLLRKQIALLSNVFKDTQNQKVFIQKKSNLHGFVDLEITRADSLIIHVV